MKAAVIHALGQPPRFEDFPEPTAGEGEVGVNVRAAGLHPFVRAQGERFSIWEPQRLPADPRHRRSGLSRRWHWGLLLQGSTTLRNDGRALTSFFVR